MNPNFWEKTQYNDVQLPPIKKMLGRPKKKKRNLEQCEIEVDGMKRKVFKIMCKVMFWSCYVLYHFLTSLINVLFMNLFG